MFKNYIFITGGVISSLGKGVTTASIAALLEACNLKVNIIKLDPYLNINSGTINPLQHGEIYVTEDGMETDLDLGHYERFTNLKMTFKNNLTSGRVYLKIIKNQYNNFYWGETIQIVPHLTDVIKEHIINISKNCDILLIELGGTIGDIESFPFLEAIKQMSINKIENNFLHIHLTLIPYISLIKEFKTKPTQNSVNTLLSCGIQPNILICRSEKIIPNSYIKKISLFCNVSKKFVFFLNDFDSIYKIPIFLSSLGLDNYICQYFKFGKIKANLNRWKKISFLEQSYKSKVLIAIVGKYVELLDAYRSIIESLKHAGLKNNILVKINFINSKKLENINNINFLSSFHGVLIPNGFGYEGVEGKIKVVEYVRKNKIPYFGICLGMQVAVIEFARNVINLVNANSTEFISNCDYPVITLINKLDYNKVDFNKITFLNSNSSMRLGVKKCYLIKNTLVNKIYNCNIIKERHRHKYKVSDLFLNKISKYKNFIISGFSFKKIIDNVFKLVEIIELTDHPWFVACQFHPEFNSTPFLPHPLFDNFIKASNIYKISK